MSIDWQNLLPPEKATCFPPADRAVLSSRYGAKLDDVHQALLGFTNGFLGFDGFFRFFGIGESAFRCIEQWNTAQGWKTSWQGRVDHFLCFAETCWGDQYAYKIGNDGTLSAEIFFLDHVSMTPECIAGSFTEFADGELAASIESSIDTMTVAAHARFRKLDHFVQLSYNPPIVIGGEEDLTNVQRVDAQQNMMLLGDFTTQYDAASEGSILVSVDVYTDADGRERVRLAFED